MGNDDDDVKGKINIEYYMEEDIALSPFSSHYAVIRPWLLARSVGNNRRAPDARTLIQFVDHFDVAVLSEKVECGRRKNESVEKL
jgi:hypothetical protein